MARYFRFPFASQGDKVVFPDTTQADGSLSYNQGYGPDYQRNPSTDNQARRIDRSRFNQLVFDITGTLQEYYQEAYPPYITASDNGGTAFEYSQYAKVRFNPGTGERVYESLKNNNDSLPSVTADWRLVDFEGLDARYALLSSLGTVAPLNTGTSAGNIPLIGTPGTTAAGANSAVVVRAGSNANGFYRVWSDGLIHQFGVLVNPVMSTGTPAPFPISFSPTATAQNISYVATTGQTSGALNLSAGATSRSMFAYAITGANAGIMGWSAFGF